MSFSTGFKSPTNAREMPWDGGSGDLSNPGNVLTGGNATVQLPDGDTYTPTSTETDAGTVLSIALLQGGYDFSLVPDNATVKGITTRSTNSFTSDGSVDLGINYFFNFSHFPDAVPFMSENYLLWQSKDLQFVLNTPTQQTLGGAADIWQPNPALYIDGMYVFSTDGSFPGYEVETSTIDPFSSDFFYNGHDLIIQPTTQGYSGSSLDASGSFSTFNFIAFVAGGGTVTVSFPGFFPPTTFVAQLGPATPGDATFQCTVDNDISLTNLSNQIGFHPDTSSYVSSSIFSGADIWELQSIDVGTYTNGIHIQSNLPQYFDFSNGGQFEGGADPDPNISTMNALAAAPLVAQSGGPMKAYPLISNQFLEITNTITHLTLQTGIPASYFKDPSFNLVEWFNPLATTGDALVYPSNTDTEILLGKTEISLTYTVSPGAGLLLLGVG